MSNDAENMILRKSLDAVERHRKRMYATVVVVFVIMLYSFFRLIDADNPTTDTRALLRHSVVFVALWTVTWALAIVFQMTRMTKILLRAIELAASKQTAG